MVSAPTAAPETIPVEVPTVAIDALLLLQLPPEVASLKVVVAPVQTVVVPVIAPAVDGAALTVTAADVATLPQLLVTV